MKQKCLAFILCLIWMVSLSGCTPDDSIDLNEEDVFADTSDYYGIVEVTAEKTALNYLTGEYNMAQDRVGYRPYCVSVNNLDQSWPQYGVSQADIVIEMETEGGITRLMCLYADTREVERIGSVRSLRDQFIEIIYPLDPVIVHIGTSIYADDVIATYNIRTLDGNQMPSIIYVDRDRMQTYSSEHCKFTSGLLIDEGLKKHNVDTKSATAITTYFNFVDYGTGTTPAGGDAAQVTFRFSNGVYDGDFRYDAGSGTYLKFQRDKAHMDAGNGEQLAFENVLVLFADIRTIEPRSGLISVDYQAGGTGYYFSKGRYEEVRWSKGEYSDPLDIKKSDGSDLLLNTGKTCLCFVRNSYAQTLTIR